MTQAIDKMTAHFRNKISGDLLKVWVEEWEMTIYYKSASTLKEQAKVIELAQKGNTVEALVETLIQRARDAEGNKIFKFADKEVLMNEVDPDVLIRVVGEMNNVVPDDLEQAQKN
jgi:hypothetical protein